MGTDINSLASKIAARLPVYTPKGARSGKSLQLWIARHRPSRELKCNITRQTGYRPAYAEEQSQARRWKGSRLDRLPELRDRVLGRLRDGWSPEQIAGRLAVETGAPVISHESIYRFIYAQIARTNNFSWRCYLPRAKCNRGYRGRKKSSPAIFIKDRVSIAQRPQEAEDRGNPGHREADLMLL